jgi:spermidine synthase
MARRAKHPAATFFALQAGITMFACGSLALLMGGLEHGWFAPLARYLARYDPIAVGTALRGVYQLLSDPGRASAQTRDLARLFLSLYFVLPSVLVGPPTLLMGLSFPLLQRIVQDDALVLGRRVGTLLAANIAGATLGAVLVGCVSLSVLGTPWTLKLLGALGSGFLFLGYRSCPGKNRDLRRVLYGTALALLASSTLAVPGPSTLWAHLHGREDDQVRAREDETGITAIADRSEDRTTVFTGGSGQSWLPYGGAHSWLGLLPLMLHPDPKRIAIIGLGSGDTVFSSGGRPETESIVCIEIVRSQLSLLRATAAERSFGGLRSLLEDPRIRFEQGDGRVFIRRGSEAYDIIEADALRPNAAFAGNLYSLEYFSMVRERLRPGGYAVSWAPTGRTIRTFAKAFPHAVVFSVENVFIAIGSVEPIRWDPKAVHARLFAPFARDYYARDGFDLESMARRVDELSPPRVFGPEYDRKGIVDFNSDLYPRDEFLAGRATTSPP